MAEGGPPDLETQRKTISEYLSAKVQKGETWYLADMRWFKQWKKYVGYDSWGSYEVGNESLHPGSIDNSSLLKSDGKMLRDHLVDDLDYTLLSDDAFKALTSWYGTTEGQAAIARQVIEQGMFVKHYKVEVYLMELKLCENSDTNKHITHAFSRADTVGTIEEEMRKLFSIPRSKEVRLWNRYMSNTYENLNKKEVTLQDVGLYPGQVIVVETQNDDGSWPRQAKSSVSSYNYQPSYTATRTANFSSAGASSSSNFDSLSSSSSRSIYGSDGIGSYYNSYDRGSSNKPGICGLTNLGNTCFMNSALQCMSNVSHLTTYMLSIEWEKELNKENPLGMRGEIAVSYNELIREIWSGTRPYVMPRNFKIAVGRFAPQFSGCQQQDAQELLAFLLDGLHEDLNRIRQKPYIELKDSDGRPDKVVAQEAWDNYKKRNDSIIVDIFHGLLKSTVRCPDCEKISVTFDPFCYLSLPLPIKKERQMEVFWVPLPPERKTMQIRLTVAKAACIRDLCKNLSAIVDVPADRMIVTDVYNHRFHKMFSMEEGVNHILDRDDIFVYEIPNSNTEDAAELILPVYFRDKKYNSRHPDTHSVSSQPLFGTPMLLAIPKAGCSYDKLYNLLMQRMARYVTVPEGMEDWHEEGQDHEDDDSYNGNDSSSSVDASNGTDEISSGHNNPVEMASDSGDSTNISNNKDDAAAGASPSTSSSPPRKQRIFSIRAANNFGRDETGTVLLDDGKPLRLSKRTYVAVDWSKAAKSRFFNEKAAEDFDQHESTQHRTSQKVTTLQLDDCLKLFMKAEQLSEQDPWFCPDCKQHKQASKKFDLWSLPEVLIIQLKRFSCNRFCRDKLDTMVEFPTEGLDLRKYITNTETTDCDIYDLIAVTNHYGGLGGGHYTAYAMNKDDKSWYYFDDSSVSNSSAESTNTKAAYVLVYQRRILHAKAFSGRPNGHNDTQGLLEQQEEGFPSVSIPNGVGAASEEDDMETN